MPMTHERVADAGEPNVARAQVGGPGLASDACQTACVDKCGEAVGKHGLQKLRIQGSQLRQRGSSFFVAPLLVVEEMLGLDPAMPSNE